MIFYNFPLPRTTRLKSKINKGFSSILLLCLLFQIPTAYAHHSHSNLDTTKTVVHTGTITKFGWRMPHVYFKVDAPNSRGEIVEYWVEMIHPPGMVALGWSKDSLAVGDLIQWSGSPDRNPNRYYTGLTWLEKADGTRLSMELDPDQNGPLLSPSLDFSGLWARDLSVPLRYGPPADWPYTGIAKELVANFDDSQNPQIECINPGPPKATILPYPMQILRTDNDFITFTYEGRDLPRKIYFDPQYLPIQPSNLGRSIAKIDGRELVIETDNFIFDRWGTYTGIDSSAQKHLVERMTLSEDGLSIDIEMVVTDPVYFTEPVTITHKLRKLPDRELVDAPCDPEGAKMYMETR